MSMMLKGEGKTPFLKVSSFAQAFQISQTLVGYKK